MRKFFISILILSALSSESAAIFYESLYCFLYTQKESSLSAYFENFPEQLSEQFSGQIKEGASESCFYDLDVTGTVSPINKATKNKTDHRRLIDKDLKVLQIYLENKLQQTFNLSYTLSVILPNEDIILQISDLSPPVIIYA